MSIAISQNVSGVKLLPILLTQNVSALTLSDALDGQVVTIQFIQNSTGNFTVASTQLNGLNQPNTAANSVSVQSFQYTALNNSWSRVPTPAGVVQALSAAGAVPVADGITTLAGSGAVAYTLVAPVAGEQDGIVMKFICITKHAHTVTTPADGIDGIMDTATFAASVPGECMTLQAYNGVWYMTSALGVTLSEV
jgi:hypothetical protein